MGLAATLIVLGGNGSRADASGDVVGSTTGVVPVMSTPAAVTGVVDVLPVGTEVAVVCLVDPHAVPSEVPGQLAVDGADVAPKAMWKVNYSAGVGYADVEAVRVSSTPDGLVRTCEDDDLPSEKSGN